MARIARVAVPGVPHHITHRGNRQQNVFLEAEDREVYKEWLDEYCTLYGLAIWSYCLMSNHVHLIGVPDRNDSLARSIGRTHWRFAQWQNRRNEWSGHLWANRFYSTPLDEDHLWAAVRYVELNPVRAGIVERAELYEWSSAPSHTFGLTDPLLSSNRPFPGHVQNWSKWLGDQEDREKLEAIRQNTRTGRPAGSQAFVAKLEAQLERMLRAPKFGRPRNEERAGSTPGDRHYFQRQTPAK